MATIVTRAGKGAPLTHTEVDANFTNLNTDKLESGSTASSLTITSADINGGTIDGTVIGGSTPAAISGTTGSFSGDVSIADKIVHTGDTDTAIRFPSNDTVAFETSGVERMRINALGNVGIGIAPSFNLDVYRSSTNTSLVAARNDTSTTVMYATASASFVGTTTNTPYGFITNNAERMRIDASGNVGIGSSAPTNLLDVNADSIRVRTAQTPASASATGNQGEIAWDADYIYVCVATNTWKRAALTTW